MYDGLRRGWLSVMDKESALAHLPGNYGFALFLRDLGLSTTEIAIRLGLDDKATTNLLRIADAKLRELMRTGPQNEGSP